MDPIHLNEADNQWYFYDELWVDKFGPYKSYGEASDNLKRYCKEVLDIEIGD